MVDAVGLARSWCRKSCCCIYHLETLSIGSAAVPDHLILEIYCETQLPYDLGYTSVKEKERPIEISSEQLHTTCNYHNTGTYTPLQIAKQKVFEPR